MAVRAEALPPALADPYLPRDRSSTGVRLRLRAQRLTRKHDLWRIGPQCHSRVHSPGSLAEFLL